MFNLERAPADPILGLTEAFRQDSHPDKINLGVGVYQDATGQTPVLESVKRAETFLLEHEHSKSYLSIPGVPELAKETQTLLFGEAHPIITEQRAKTAQTPGGTGALRVAADFIKRATDNRTVWLSNPSWANHRTIFEAAGFTVRDYRYYDATTQGLDEAGLMQDLELMGQGDTLILHGCCHNPSGIDLTDAAWARIAEVAKAKGLICLVDFAYQGFGESLEDDRAGLHVLLDAGLSVLIASSYSKNFGLYNERTGAVTVVEDEAESALDAFSHIQAAIRAIYSSPPAHGGKIVATILSQPDLKAVWMRELAEMRTRIKSMRQAFVNGMADRNTGVDFEFINHQQGMFSFSGLSKAQVETLRTENHIYIVGSGRINVAGITPANIDPLCDAIAKVV
jgi:aspartate/tyrosine/aromatic aminotransferase